MENKLEVIYNGIKSVTFKINSEEKTIDDYNTLCDIISNLEKFKKYIDFVIPIKKYYENYENEIDNILNNQKNDFTEDDKYYSIGGYFGFFLDCDLDTAISKLKELYEKEFDKEHKLEFDPDSDFIFIHTENIIVAKQFMLLTYQKIIKPFFDNLEK